MLMAEIHDESRMNFSRDVLTLNVGLRHEFTENYSPASAAMAFLGFLLLVSALSVTWSRASTTT